MSINATRSEGNTDRMYGYLEGYADGLKCGKENMKNKACRVFQEMLMKYNKYFGDNIPMEEWENEFRKRLEE